MVTRGMVDAALNFTHYKSTVSVHPKSSKSLACTEWAPRCAGCSASKQ